MTDKSNAMLVLYERLFEQVKSQYRHDPSLSSKDILEVIGKSRDFILLQDKANADELALVLTFLKRDIGSYLANQHLDEISYSPSVLVVENKLWQWLGEITDKTQIEWHEMAQDFKHEGHYRSGEIINQGQMRCVHCLHEIEINYPSALPICPQCQGEEFIRQPLSP